MNAQDTCKRIFWKHLYWVQRISDLFTEKLTNRFQSPRIWKTFLSYSNDRWRFVWNEQLYVYISQSLIKYNKSLAVRLCEERVQFQHYSHITERYSEKKYAVKMSSQWMFITPTNTPRNLILSIFISFKCLTNQKSNKKDYTMITMYLVLLSYSCYGCYIIISIY